MATRKKRPAAQQLPGVDAGVAGVAREYRVEPGQVKRAEIDAVLSGRADLDKLTPEQLGVLVRVLMTLRLEAFALPFCAWDDSAYSVVRKHLRSLRPSEMARAVIGSGRHPFWSAKQPKLPQILPHADVLQKYADDKAPPPPRARDTVLTEYLLLLPIVSRVDLFARFPDVDKADRSSTPALEVHIRAMRGILAASRSLTDDEKKAVGLG